MGIFDPSLQSQGFAWAMTLTCLVYGGFDIKGIYVVVDWGGGGGGVRNAAFHVTTRLHHLGSHLV